MVSLFTPAERRVAEFLTEGFSNLDIAKNLGLSPRTVEIHIGNMRRKSGATNRTALALKIVRSSSQEASDAS